MTHRARLALGELPMGGSSGASTSAPSATRWKLRRASVRGKVIRVQTIEHHPPDTTACIFWLKNRQPEKWSYKFKVKQAAAQWNFIGLIPTEEEWTARYCSHSEPILVKDKSDLSRSSGSSERGAER
jgi:hypothetical protein